MSKRIFDIIKSITNKMGELLGVRVYITLTDHNGNFIASDSVFDNYKNFIQNFIKSNFDYLNIGDHSIPLSNENIIFFKTSDNSITVLYNPVGKIGQLLTFKTLMVDYTDIIDHLISENYKDVSINIIKTPNDLQIPQKELITPIISKKERLYLNIKPILKRYPNEKEKFSFTETHVLKDADSGFTLLDIINDVKITDFKAIEILYKFFVKKLISFKDYELIRIPCPECRNSAYLFISKLMLKNSKHKIRAQLSPEGCEHTFLAFIDKNLKIKTKIIEQLENPSNTLDISNLAIKNFISFFGQDIFFNLFHAIFFRIPVLIVGEDISSINEEIMFFLRKIFPLLEYGVQIFISEPKELERNFKKYKNCLIIDFDSAIAIEPYEDKEYFDFESKMFKKILKINDQNLQILEANNEIERLNLHTETILRDLEPILEISEDDLIQKMKSLYEITIERYEIPIIMKLAEIYYNIDISKKLKRTITGQMSSFLDKM